VELNSANGRMRCGGGRRKNRRKKRQTTAGRTDDGNVGRVQDRWGKNWEADGRPCEPMQTRAGVGGKVGTFNVEDTYSDKGA